MNTLTILRFNQQHLLIGVLMLAAAGLAVALTPKAKVADQGPRIDLETMIPKEFGEWRVDESIVPLQVSPDVQAKLDRLYSQTLSRTYINEQGYRIMLSIAYGSNQSDTLSVHKPEVCYPAQGFEVLHKEDGRLVSETGSIPVRRVLAKNGARIEPITYWITVAGKPTVGRYERKLAKLAYTLTGKVPDGILVRVSSIDSDIERAHRYQDAFVGNLLAYSTPDNLERLIGKSSVTQ